MIQIIAAIMPLSTFYLDRDKYVIGVQEEGNHIMPWSVPSDLKHFKNTTKNTTIVMGYTTWESIGKRMLPGRPHIIITRSPEQRAKEVKPQEGLSFCTMERALFILLDIYNQDKIFSVCGGGEIYSYFLENNLFDKVIISGLHRALVDTKWFRERDTNEDTDYVYFPAKLLTQLKLEKNSYIPKEDKDDCSFNIMVYVK
jgi:dihydrofolate reductase